MLWRRDETAATSLQPHQVEPALLEERDILTALLCLAVSFTPPPRSGGGTGAQRVSGPLRRTRAAGVGLGGMLGDATAETALLAADVGVSWLGC